MHTEQSFVLLSNKSNAFRRYKGLSFHSALPVKNCKLATLDNRKKEHTNCKIAFSSDQISNKNAKLKAKVFKI